MGQKRGGFACLVVPFSLINFAISRRVFAKLVDHMMTPSTPHSAGLIPCKRLADGMG